MRRDFMTRANIVEALRHRPEMRTVLALARLNTQALQFKMHIETHPLEHHVHEVGLLSVVDLLRRSYSLPRGVPQGRPLRSRWRSRSWCCRRWPWRARRRALRDRRKRSRLQIADRMKRWWLCRRQWWQGGWLGILTRWLWHYQRWSRGVVPSRRRHQLARTRCPRGGGLAQKVGKFRQRCWSWPLWSLPRWHARRRRFLRWRRCHEGLRSGRTRAWWRRRALPLPKPLDLQRRPSGLLERSRRWRMVEDGQVASKVPR